ncbi:MAG: paraquat-inducible protein A [Saprospiraceae bacterium]
MLKNAILALALLLFCYAGYNSYNLYNQVRLQKELKEDLAAINMVTYGLFDIQLWKEQALGIFKKNIEDYEIEPSAYQALDRTLQIYLKGLYKQYFESGELIDMILEKLVENGSLNKMFATIIQKNIGSQLANLDLEKEIPGLSKSLISEIKKNESQIKMYFQDELLSMVMADVKEKLSDRRVPYYKKYGFTSYGETNNHLTQRVAIMQSSERHSVIANGVILAVLILLLIISWRWIGFKMMILGLTLVSVVFLILGITFPMIDIDARLNAFSISLMGEPISFGEQVIYFQSKSILDVTNTLWQGQGWDLKLVSSLVFCFSIVFPLTKLVLSAFYLFSKKLSNNKTVQNIIFHLGKWSMADVFVVAMFMAYIGFYGIITSQLSSISNNPNGYAVETLNYSRLAPGALYFTIYCLLSIVIGILINKKSETHLNPS